jgi:predicted DNA binding CopG/RHH family protein
MGKTKDRIGNWADYYDHSDILEELLEEPIHFSLDPELQKEILAGSRAKKLKNITIKMDPIQIQMIRKLATTKSLPYQTLIRHWLSEKIKSELRDSVS